MRFVSVRARLGRALALAALTVLGGSAAARAEPAAELLPPLREPGAPYRTPRAGEGFHTQLFGDPIEITPRDRRSVTALQVGSAFTAPGPSGAEVIPYGALFLFRRPDPDHFLEAILIGIQNDVLFARSPRGFGPFEYLLTLETSTVPVARSDLVGGERLKEEQLLWGFVRGGLGLGYRTDVAPGAADNMFSAALLVQPGFFFFDDGSDTRDDFVVPRDTFELRARLRVTHDAFERNLLEMVHRGFGFGLDASIGHRARWDDWGVQAREKAGSTQTFASLLGYAKFAAGLPGASERHRLIGALHFTVGDDLDRFSAPRIGGGPDGDEFKAIARPLIPGAVIEEFHPKHYVVALAEYRYELLFFTYLSLRTSLTWLDRDRLRAGTVRHENDWLPSLGARITTGFPFRLWLRLDYNYNFGVIRRGDELGGHEVVLALAREF